MYSQSYGFSSHHIWMWELDYKEGWAPKNWFFWTVVLEKTLESPLDCKEIKPDNPRWNQSWVFIGRTDETERRLLLGRKAMTNKGSMLKSRDITLLTNVCIAKAMVFLVVMYRCESWTIRKAEHWRNDAFKLWCWRSLLRVPLDCKEIKPVNPKGNQI